MACTKPNNHSTANLAEIPVSANRFPSSLFLFLPGAIFGLLLGSLVERGVSRTIECTLGNPLNSVSFFTQFAVIAFALTFIYRIPRLLIAGQHSATRSSAFIAGFVAVGMAYSTVAMLESRHLLTSAAAYLSIDYLVIATVVAASVVVGVETEARLASTQRTARKACRRTSSTGATYTPSSAKPPASRTISKKLGSWFEVTSAALTHVVVLTMLYTVLVPICRMALAYYTAAGIAETIGFARILGVSRSLNEFPLIVLLLATSEVLFAAILIRKLRDWGSVYSHAAICSIVLGIYLSAIWIFDPLALASSGGRVLQ